MNPVRLTLLTLALCAGLTSAANAVPIVVNLTAPPVGDIPKNGSGIGGANGNDSADNFFRLETFLAAHPGNGTAISDMSVHLGGNGMDVDVSGYSFAVVHYGAGHGGTHGSGGGVEIFSISGTGLFSFPSHGAGPNGFGGFSSVDLFKGAPVPDGGTAVMLFGTALSALGLARRYLKR
ncbi:MAG TPA: VPDSG-CTERM sorting domain-containing protein [Chthoniobacterales bacterium]|jgi:hypothetical protein